MKLPSIMALPESTLEETEKDLEEELQRDKYIPPEANKFERFRHKGALVLHSKHVLLLVVILNLVDCSLVLSELILDIHYVKELRGEMESKAQSFIDEMQMKYPARLNGFAVETIDRLYDEVYKADCSWDDDTNGSGNQFQNRTAREAGQSGGTAGTGDSGYTRTGRYRRAASDSGGEKSHSVLEDIAHAFHKASIAILGILFVENIMKVVCMGAAFFKHKLEVFDAIVVAVSFVVDVVLLKGLTEFEVQVALFILSFLLPWRVIRLVNSLIVAVLDHEHFRLKMMYKEKKIVDAQLVHYKEMKKRWDFHLQKIESFCESEGIPKWKIRQHTALGRRQSIVTSMASLALNSVLQNLSVGLVDKMQQEDAKPADTDGDVEKALSAVKTSDSCDTEGVVNEAFQMGERTPSVSEQVDSNPATTLPNEMKRSWSTQILVRCNKD